MIQLSRHFRLDEFTRSDKAIELGDANTPTPTHLANLTRTALGMEHVREALGGRAITITSGYRNPRVNAAVGGVANSDHALGWAVDFRSADLAPFSAGKVIAASPIDFDQLIYEISRGILHISFNPRMRRQLLTQRGGPGTPFETGLRP